MRLRPLLLAIAVLAALAAGAVTGVPGSSAAPAVVRVVAPLLPVRLDGLQTGPRPWHAGWAHLAQRLRAIGLPALSEEGQVMHIHQHLDVRVDGRAVIVPAAIGFGSDVDQKAKFVSPLHTHDIDGIIHVESPVRQVFTLGDFFDVWGLRFSASCLGSYCAHGDARVRVYVNGRLVEPGGDPRAVVLESQQEILVSYGTRRQLPARIAKSFAFEPGL